MAESAVYRGARVFCRLTWYCDVDGVLLTKDGKTLMLYPVCRGQTPTGEPDAFGYPDAYTVPDGVERIAAFAFLKNEHLMLLAGLIIPLMFVGAGFTSDWDVLYMDDVRIRCMVIGIAFDLVGYVLMLLPYIFFWDYTDEKHVEIMKVLQERADRAQEDSAETDMPQLTAETVSAADEI